MVGLAAPAGGCAASGTIAIIDTLVDKRHPALRGANLRVRDFIGVKAKAASAGHGTAVATLLVGQGPAPLAPSAKILAAGAFREVDGAARADVVALLRALDWAASQGAEIVLMSLEGPANSALELGVRAVGRGANVVAAAGNGGPRGGPHYPGAYPEVIAVAAVDHRMRPYRGGSRGAYVELAAPGVEILSAGADGGFERWTGTSFAAPYVAAALLRARRETGGDAASARKLLARTSIDLGAAGRDPIFGHGLLQAPDCR